MRKKNITKNFFESVINTIIINYQKNIIEGRNWSFATCQTHLSGGHNGHNENDNGISVI